jgi:signal transduction histidine kinase/CheY-like chemotaxis protein
MLNAIFSDPGFMPHIHCYLGDTALTWSMVLTDALIGTAYVCISLTLWVLIRRIRLEFNLVVICFGVFIGACGATHFMEIWTLWHPDYWLEAFIKLVTATASVGTGIYLFRLRHSLVALAESAKLSEQRKIDLEHAALNLESRVQDRTRELETLGARFQKASEASNLGVWYCDLPFDELIWNKKTREHFWIPASTKIITINDFYAYMHVDDRERTRAAIENSIANKVPYDIEYRTVNPINTTDVKWIRAIGWTDYDSQGNPLRFDGITLDLTDQKSTAEELRKSKGIAEKANEMKSMFLTNMSHEIRTPLGAIIGFLDLLSSHVQNNPEAESYLERLTRNSTQLSSLVDELLDLSKIEANKLDLELHSVDLKTLMNDVVATVGVSGRAKGIVIKVDMAADLPKKIESDSMRLRQVLLNLVGNAVKFTDRGTVSVEVSIQKSTPHHQLTFRISDTGIGLTKDQQSKLFTPFTQADGSISRRFGGTGLGLALSQDLAKLLGGSIVLENSEEGVGTTFAFKIPVLLQTSQKLPPADRDSSQQIVPRKEFENKSILIVDDSPDNRVLVEKFLEPTGAKITTAVDGSDAIQKIKESQFDLILMDLQMPVVDGYQAVMRIRKDRNMVPIIALTAHALKEERDRSLAAGFDDYITKPINKLLLVEAIRNSLFKKN